MYQLVTLGSKGSKKKKKMSLTQSFVRGVHYPVRGGAREAVGEVDHWPPFGMSAPSAMGYPVDLQNIPVFGLNLVGLYRVALGSYQICLKKWDFRYSTNY